LNSHDNRRKSFMRFSEFFAVGFFFAPLQNVLANRSFACRQLYSNNWQSDSDLWLVSNSSKWFLLSSLDGKLSSWGLLRWTIPPYTTVRKGPVWKAPTAEINCIPPRLKLWYRVICIVGIRWYKGIIGSIFRWHKWNICFLSFKLFLHFPAYLVWSIDIHISRWFSFHRLSRSALLFGAAAAAPPPA
jgi:hypothetical protein